MREAFDAPAVREHLDTYLLLREEFDAHFVPERAANAPAGVVSATDLLESLPPSYKENAHKDIIENHALENFIVMRQVVDYLAKNGH